MHTVPIHLSAGMASREIPTITPPVAYSSTAGYELPRQLAHSDLYFPSSNFHTNKVAHLPTVIHLTTVVTPLSRVTFLPPMTLLVIVNPVSTVTPVLSVAPRPCLFANSSTCTTHFCGIHSSTPSVSALPGPMVFCRTCTR